MKADRRLRLGHNIKVHGVQTNSAVGQVTVVINSIFFPPPPPGHPNEPFGFARLAESNFSVMPSGANQLAGSWYNVPSGGVGSGATGVNASIVADATDPTGEGHAMQIVYPAGLHAGYSPANIGVGFPAQNGLYLDYYFKIDGSDFELQPVGVKILGFRGVGGVNNAIYFLLRGPGGSVNPIITNGEIDFAEQNVVNYRYYGTTDGQFSSVQGISTGTPVDMLPVGTWLRIIELHVLNTPDQFDGQFDMWIGVGGGDPQLVHHHTAVKYQTRANPGGFIQLRWDATWGGAGTTSKLRDDSVRLGYMYISGGTVGADPYPNKPVDITTLRYSLNAADPNNPLFGVNNGTPLPRTNLAVNAGQLETTWPLGLAAGASVITAFDLNRDDANAYQSYYMKAKFTLPDPTFTSHVVQSKFLYNRYGDRAANNQGVCMCLYPGPVSNNNTPLTALQMMMQMSQNLSGGSIPIYANAVLRADAYWINTQVEHTYEVYVDVGTVDNHDATIKVWIDGQLYMWYGPDSPYFWPNPNEWSGSIVSPTNKGSAVWLGTWINPTGGSQIKLLDSASGFTVGFYGLHFAPVWGGSGGTPATKQQTDHHRFSQLDYFVGAVKP